MGASGQHDDMKQRILVSTLGLATLAMALALGTTARPVAALAASPLDLQVPSPMPMPSTMPSTMPSPMGSPMGSPMP
jgi:hypothetical protein